MCGQGASRIRAWISRTECEPGEDDRGTARQSRTTFADRDRRRFHGSPWIASVLRLEVSLKVLMELPGDRSKAVKFIETHHGDFGVALFSSSDVLAAGVAHDGWRCFWRCHALPDGAPRTFARGFGTTAPKGRARPSGRWLRLPPLAHGRADAWPRPLSRRRAHHRRRATISGDRADCSSARGRGVGCAGAG